MEATLILRAEANILKPFETLAKQFGIFAEFAKKEETALQKYRRLATETQKAGRKAGLNPENINDFIKEYRKEKRAKVCA